MSILTVHFDGTPVLFSPLGVKLGRNRYFLLLVMGSLLFVKLDVAVALFGEKFLRENSDGHVIMTAVDTPYRGVPEMLIVFLGTLIIVWLLLARCIKSVLFVQKLNFDKVVLSLSFLRLIWAYMSIIPFFGAVTGLFEECDPEKLLTAHEKATSSTAIEIMSFIGNTELPLLVLFSSG